MYQTTSAEAYAFVSQQLGDRQREVLAAFLKHGPMTNTEASTVIGLPINQITPRTNELVKLGRLKDAGRKKCSITGRTAIVWTPYVKETLF